MRYKVLFHLPDIPYDDGNWPGCVRRFSQAILRRNFIGSRTDTAAWADSVQRIIPQKTNFQHRQSQSSAALDRDILLRAYEYLEDLLKGTAHEKFSYTNERVIPSNTAAFCTLIKAAKPYNELCDSTYYKWKYIAECAFESGEYSYERQRPARYEVFLTREDRLVPMLTELLLKRRDQVPPQVEKAMLRHYGKQAYDHGYFWNNRPAKLPDHFVYEKIRRWLYSFLYINKFYGSALYLANSADWLMQNQNAGGLWDWGKQTKDPWGYFGYFSANRDYRHNRITDCSMEILDFLKNISITILNNQLCFEKTYAMIIFT